LIFENSAFDRGRTKILPFRKWPKRNQDFKPKGGFTMTTKSKNGEIIMTTKVKEEKSMNEKSNENSSPEKFNLEKLRLTQDFASQIGVKKVLLTIPVRNPNKQEFIRIHPHEDYQLQTAVLELKDEGETYLEDQSLWSELADEIEPKVLVVAISRQKVCFLWAIKLPKDDGRQNEWHRSALEAAQIAKTKWVRVQANMSLRAYDVYEATGNLPEPEWPEVDFQKMIETAFKDRFINSIEHPVLKSLRGEN
jgi:hypothetical protein